MRCTSPKTVGFKSDGKTLCWSPKNYSKEYPTFQLPCSKCISCRLEYARQWAQRCVHEASMYENNSFITLTYNDENLGDNKLNYKDFQDFMKRLRSKEPHLEISYFVTGEYGEKSKRKHWHAIIFNWEPPDKIHQFTTDRGDRVFTSSLLDSLWGHGETKTGAVTIESAGYTARYSAKKLVHGKDQNHDYTPISKKSSKHAIGKRWLEKHWEDVFNHGYIINADGVKSGVPRYYEKWLKRERPGHWRHYRTKTKEELLLRLIKEEEETSKQEFDINWERLNQGKSKQITRNETRAQILKQKFDQLQQLLKL